MARNEEDKAGDKASELKNWYTDKYQSVLVQRNIFAVITLVSLLTSLIAVFAVQSLAPLKSVEPFVIQIDEKSGVTEVVEPVTREELSATEALDNFFVWQYVRARETYDAADNPRNRDIVRIMSHPDVYAVHRFETSPQAPESAYNRLGKIGTRVCSDPVITYLDAESKEEGKKVAQVRFVVTERIRAEAPFEYNKIATLEYDYVTLELSRRERLINPLGFRALTYRLDDATVQK